MNNRKQPFTLLFASLTALVLCFALAGCSSDGNDNTAGSSASNSAATSSAADSSSADNSSADNSATSDNDAAFVGTWKIVSLKYPSGTEYDKAELKKMDMDYSITLNADGTAKYKYGDTVTDATWKADSPTSLTLIFDKDEEEQLVLEDGKLVEEVEGMFTYYYEKD